MAIEFTILDFIQTHLRSDILDSIMVLITGLGNGGAIWLLGSALLLLSPKTRKAAVAVMIGLILEALGCNLIFKPLFHRIRPCDVNTAITLLIAHPYGFSFPSGHTGASFAAVSALYGQKQRLWLPALILAVFIAFSRLYLYVHFPSDVLAGAIWGTLMGWISSLTVNALARKWQESHASSSVL